MARKSAASLAIVPSLPDSRPEPPAGLSEAEAALWVEIVDSKPSDWFGADSAPLLTEYVRAVVMCDRLAVLLDRALEASGSPPDDDAPRLPRVDDLLVARDRESRRATTIATKLRLTQQSRYTPQAASTASRKAGGKRPWQT